MFLKHDTLPPKSLYATEIFVQQRALPELQQLTFSSYKNHNTYKGLIGISPSGAVTFISILDKKLTGRSGLLIQSGFDIKEDLALLGVIYHHS